MIMLLAAFLCAGCRDEAPTTGRYPLSGIDATIDFPEGWMRKGYPEGFVIAVSPPAGDDDQFQEMMHVKVLTAGQGSSLDELAEKYFSRLGEGADDVERTESGSAKIAGRDARWTICSQTVITEKEQERVRVTSLQYLVIEGDKLILINGTATPETFEKYREAFETAVKSLKFGE